MSCRIFKHGATVAERPIVWPQTGRPTAASEPVRPSHEFDAEARRQLESQVKAAYQKGRTEGEAAGRQRGAAEIQPALERLGRSIEELSELRAQLRAEAEADLVKLAVAIARRILRREVATDPDALHGLVVAALEKVQAQDLSRVKVHPSHVGFLTTCMRNASASRIEIMPDPSLEPGALVFETVRGNLDASVTSQLNEIERGLTDRLRRES